jgi:hypothetical protein
MSLLAIVISLIVVGALLWLEETYIPMDASIKTAIRVVVLVVVVLWLLQSLGVFNFISDIKINQIKA